MTIFFFFLLISASVPDIYPRWRLRRDPCHLKIAICFYTGVLLRTVELKKRFIVSSTSNTSVVSCEGRKIPRGAKYASFFSFRLVMYFKMLPFSRVAFVV